MAEPMKWVTIVDRAGTVHEFEIVDEVARAGGTGGTTDYTLLYNKPKIESVELNGDQTFEDLGLEKLSNVDIDAIWNRVFNS